jgi:hypothetical protein
LSQQPGTQIIFSQQPIALRVLSQQPSTQIGAAPIPTAKPLPTVQSDILQPTSIHTKIPTQLLQAYKLRHDASLLFPPEISSSSI